nr:glycosyltransferase family A protein [Fulvivirga marina]
MINFPVSNNFSIFITTDRLDEFEISSLQDIPKLKEFPYSFVGLIQKDLEEEIGTFFSSGFCESSDNCIFLLTKRLDLPKFSGLEQGELMSFVCSGNILSGRFNELFHLPFEKWAYHIVSWIYDLTIKPFRLEVVQLPYRDNPISIENGERVNIILPHKGSARDLEACLNLLTTFPQQNYNVMIGFDDYEDSKTLYQELIESYNQWEFYKSEPSHKGPFVIREHLINQLSDGFILYQDSDDLSTTDRLTKLTQRMLDENHMIGSHEVIYDEITETLRVKRFPLDVNLALITKPAFPLLHSTAITSVSGFKKVGGYSTDRKFANDTQFLYRCHFVLRVQNIDEFLYIRKIHKDSLTNLGEHPLDGPVRRNLGETWRNDFIDVLNKKKELEETSLRTKKNGSSRLVELIIDNKKT